MAGLLFGHLLFSCAGLLSAQAGAAWACRIGGELLLHAVHSPCSDACRHRQIYEPNTLEITEEPASTECFASLLSRSTYIEWMVGRELAGVSTNQISPAYE